MPVRVQLRRTKGWKMPPNTLKVDRTTKWGNPFVVGLDGTTADCVNLYRHLLLGSRVCLTCAASIDSQKSARRHVFDHAEELRGKNLACWCRAGKPCHADVLLEIANAPEQVHSVP